jgi:tripartite-type tricarboxylate transporter receptor subunit TctC
MKQLITLLLLIPVLALAWEPSKPVTVLVGFAPGSGNEIAFREASSIVQKNNPRVSFVVENKPGADAVIAQNQLFTSPADGYTISVPSHMSLFVTNDIWQKNVKKFQWDSFINVVTLGKSPLAVVVQAKSPIDSPTAFSALLRMGYRPVNVAVGGGAHLMAFEYIMQQSHADDSLIKAIRYQGPLQAVTAVAGEQTEFGIMPIAVARPLVEAGRVKVIGLTSNKTLGQYAGLDKEFPGLNVYAGWMISLPPNTPADIVSWYQREFSRAIRSQEYRTWAEKNQILIAVDELTPAGTKKYGEKLRKTFAPIAEKIHE